MSRIGRMPIAIPAGVTVTVNGSEVSVKGPKAELKHAVHPNMTVTVEDGVIHVTRPNDEKQNREVNGVGYRVQKTGKDLVMNLGYSHQVVVPEIDGITIECPSANKIIVSGPDKQKVGQFAAEIREKRPPEPYKGKGIKYADEHIRRKEGKTGSKKK